MPKPRENKDPEWKIMQDHANFLLGLKGTKGSGNVHGDSDGYSELFMNECKFRHSAALTIPREEYDKLLKEAKARNKIPLFTIIRPKSDKMNLDRKLTTDECDFFTVIRTNELQTLLNTNAGHEVVRPLIEEVVNYLTKKGISSKEVELIEHRLWKKVENPTL